MLQWNSKDFPGFSFPHSLNFNLCVFSLWVNWEDFSFCELSTFLQNHRHPLLTGFMTITILACRNLKKLSLLFPSHFWLPQGTPLQWKGIISAIRTMSKYSTVSCSYHIFSCRTVCPTTSQKERQHREKDFCPFSQTIWDLLPFILIFLTLNFELWSTYLCMALCW